MIDVAVGTHVVVTTEVCDAGFAFAAAQLRARSSDVQLAMRASQTREFPPAEFFFVAAQRRVRSYLRLWYS